MSRMSVYASNVPYGNCQVRQPPRGWAHRCVVARWRGLSTVISTLAVTLLPLHPLVGQQASRVTISADTGVLIPGHRDFSRYTTPGWCRAAARTAATLLRRTIEFQTSLVTLRPVEDTLGSGGVAAVARACGEHFTIASAAARAQDLSALLDLALYEQNDTLAQAVLARVVALAPTPATVQDNYVEAIRYSLDEAKPPGSVRAAEAFVAKLDALGQSALVARLQAHSQLLAFWQRNDDAVRSRHEAEQIIALGHALPAAELTRSLPYGPIWHAYQELMTEAFLATPDSLPVIAQRYEQELSRAHLTPTASPQMVINQLTPHSMNRLEKNARFPLLHATYWFPAAAGDTVRPVPGKVNLFVGIGGGVMTTEVRHWLAQYDAQGLVITVVVPTRGASWSTGNLDILNGPWTPAEEAKQLEWYWHTYEHLPVTVAVQETHWQWRPAPDGRRIQVDTTSFGKMCGDDMRGCVVLVGRDGVVMFQGHPIPTQFDAGEGILWEKKQFGLVLKWTMAHPTPVAPSASAASVLVPRPVLQTSPSSPLAPHASLLVQHPPQ